VLYSSRQASITTLASVRLWNHCMPRHSSRNFPSKLSFDPFCQGFPGSIHAVSIFSSTSQRRIAREMNSDPLSDRS
jgi:hypothetical protein